MTSVTAERLMETLQGLGYDCTKHDEKRIGARHPTRMNLMVRIIPEREIILFVHAWQTKKGWRGVPLDAINEVNRICLVNTCSIDSDGDIAGSFYLPISAGFSEEEMKHLLELADDEFKIAALAKLANYMG